MTEQDWDPQPATLRDGQPRDDTAHAARNAAQVAMADELRVEACVAGEWVDVATLSGPAASETAVALNDDAGVPVRLVDADGEEVGER